MKEYHEYVAMAEFLVTRGYVAGSLREVIDALMARDSAQQPPKTAAKK